MLYIYIYGPFAIKRKETLKKLILYLLYMLKMFQIL
jgi:hypothetical protein